MICFKCGKEITEEWKNDKLVNSDGIMIGLDKPYVNIWFHRECEKNVDLNQFLSDNVDKIADLCYNKGEKRAKENKNWYSKTG